MITILTGPPGAGKGTQADLLVERDGFKKLSTGDALRSQIRQGTEIGKKAEEFMCHGQLVPDDILLQILGAELGKLRNSRILLDGYPRNVAQVRTLDELSEDFPVDSVVDIQVPKDLLIQRISGRRVCSNCGASFHVDFAPPNIDGSCKRCGSEVKQRSDDSVEKATVRLDVYDSETRPILEFYSQRGLCQHIDGNGDLESVYTRIANAISGI